ncbi:PepSY-associated TM helix domain-containing protein [Sphingomonas sp.]|jgi:uncharacterized iron-regulated membrane protein|uniref:PepSY-associated TM helix domain-containing protein n=1 Tax=Sphingomonas sp. TaxID=28214 RepID=UPI002ED7E073
MSQLKPKLLKLHRWFGLALGVLLLVQGLTGASLVFRDEIERLIHPAMVVAPLPQRVPVQAMLDAVESANPNFSVSRAEFPEWNDGAVLFKMIAADGTRRLAAVDPYRGTIVREGTMFAWPGEWLFHVHDSLLAGPVGETLVGVEGLGLLFMAITGPIIWWPGRKRIKQGLKVTLDKGADRRWRTLHRAGGAMAAMLLVVSALTGVLMVWKAEFRQVLRIAGPVTDKPTPKVQVIPGATMVPLDALIAQAQAELGAAPLRQLRFSSGGRVAAVYLDSDFTVRADGFKQAYYNRYNGAGLGHYVAGRLPVGTEIVDWLITIHTGAFGGLPSRLLFLLGGLSLAALSASGLWLWYSRTSRRRKPRAMARPTVEGA